MIWFSTRTQQKIRDLEDSVEKLNHDLKMLRIEWEDAYDKMRTLTARFVKRAARIEQLEQQEQPANGSESQAPVVSPQLDPMSRRILERRQRLFARTAGAKEESR